MSEKTHLMLDIETLGTTPATPVISIGAVFFSEDGLGETFSANLDTSIQIKDGRRPDGDTIKWWMSQSDAAKKVFSEDALPPEVVLKKFANFCIREGNKKSNKPWGRGANFDITIMEDLFAHYGVEVPWMFYNVRCHRTFTEEVYDGRDMERKGVYHNALDDAIYQAEVVIEGWKRAR